MTDAEKALAQTVKEAHESVCALVSTEFQYGQPLHDKHPLSGDCRWRHAAIDRALDLARKVGRLERVEEDYTTAMVCSGVRVITNWLQRERDRLRREVEEATRG